LQVAVPMTATSKQEPPIPTDEPTLSAPEAVVVREVVIAADASPVSAASPEANDTSPEASPEASEPSPEPKRPANKKAASGTQPNNVRKLRQAAMMSKAELARRAGVSPLTIDRVESGCPCRMDTKRKILEALGLKPEAREQVFGPDIDQG
jgi:DNA-binding XRE family transcriptional regulator